jgi:type I restriction enzyme, S subunit
MKSYSLYKDIGLDFLGRLPEHWYIAKLKHLASISFSSVDKHSFEDEIPVRLCNYVDVYKNDLIGSDMSFMQATATETEIERFTLREGDVLITKDSESWEDIAVPAYVNEDIDGVLCGYHLALIRPSAIDPKYLFWVFCSSTLNDQYKVEAHGITRYGLGKDSIENSVIPVPSILEQQDIARFLDCKTAQIDALIKKKQRQIDLLQEQRTALINHAVTKGLNPDSPMKDSGVEWLGEIPCRWEIKRLRRYKVLVQTGPFGSQLHSSDYVPNGYPVVNPANMINGSIVPDESKQVSFEKRQELSQHILQKGDIVFARRGELGRAVLVTGQEEGWLCGTGSILIRFLEARLRSDYLSYYLQLPSLRDHFLSESVGSTMDNLNSQILLAMPILEPPSIEQAEIVEYVSSIREKTRQAIEKISKQIELLQEYRTALISEAVTGKIDVRS